jgi:predicted kinase
MTQRPILIICCGLPFAGKSTLAHALAAACGWTRIALDDVMISLGLWDQQEPITQQQWDDAYTVAHTQIRTALHAGQSVIYDATNHTRLERDHLRALATATASDTCVVHIATEPAIVYARIAANRQHPQRGDVTDAQVQYVIAHFDIPTTDEYTIVYTPDTPLLTVLQACSRG